MKEDRVPESRDALKSDVGSLMRYNRKGSSRPQDGIGRTCCARPGDRNSPTGGNLCCFLRCEVRNPAELRNSLMHLVLTDLFEPSSQQTCNDEWISNLPANRPDVTRAQLQHTENPMDLQPPFRPAQME